MLKAVVLPSFGTPSVWIKVFAIHAARGALLEPGSALLDVMVQFDAGVTYQCPPISHFRIFTRDPGWLCRLHVSRGDAVEPAAVLARLGSSSDDDEIAPDAPPARVSVASILPQDDWWSEPA